MLINTVLTKFAQEELVLGYKSAEREKINNSLFHLEKILMDRVAGLYDIIHFGSYKRNTILPRRYDSESDIDLMLVFNHDGNTSPETYRNKVKKVVEVAYPKSLSKKDFPVVKLELNHIMFDLVPSFVKDDFWGNETFYIPSKKSNWSQWQTTIPHEINDDLSKKNQSYGNNIVRNVIRLCKHWNANIGRVFESYELEKWIVNRFLFYGDNLYSKFLSIMDDKAGHISEVRDALNHIKWHKGSLWRSANEAEQLDGLQELLPGLKDNFIWG